MKLQQVIHSFEQLPLFRLLYIAHAKAMHNDNFYAQPHAFQDLANLAQQASPTLAASLSQLPHTSRALERAQEQWQQRLAHTASRNAEQAERMHELLALFFAADATLAQTLGGSA